MCHAKQHNNDNKMLDINMISYGWIQQNKNKKPKQDFGQYWIRQIEKSFVIMFIKLTRCDEI